MFFSFSLFFLGIESVDIDILSIERNDRLRVESAFYHVLGHPTNLLSLIDIVGHIGLGARARFFLELLDLGSEVIGLSLLRLSHLLLSLSDTLGHELVTVILVNVDSSELDQLGI